MNNLNFKIIDYNHHVNQIDTNQSWGILVQLGFPKMLKDPFYKMCDLLEKLGSLYTPLYNDSLKEIKDYSEEVWLELNRRVTNSSRKEINGKIYYIKNPYTRIHLDLSDLKISGTTSLSREGNQLILDMIRIINSKNYSLGVFQRFVHTITRMGEFVYISDDTMQELTKDINDFIESGDCKLFDYEKCPYKGDGLTGDLVRDIEEQESNVRKYNKDNGLADISSQQIVDALKKMLYYKDHINESPECLRGILLNLVDISNQLQKEGLNNLDTYYKEGIPEIDIFHKMSGSGFNKEPIFQQMCDHFRIASFKNPEAAGFLTKSNILMPKNAVYDTYCPKCLSNFLMDVIWYSIGKGPWKKTRYVGQCTSFHQSLLAPYERIVKNILHKNHDYFNNKSELIRLHQWTSDKKYAQYSNDSIYIYDNINRLKELVIWSKDLISSDFSAYTDYMNRDILIFICSKLLDMNPKTCSMIQSLYSMPVRINGINYHYKWGSVMGLKFNFLLITIANWLMWAIGVIITKRYDVKAIFMGDDRLEGTSNNLGFDRDYLLTQLSVCSFMNCVINESKTEWLNRDGFSSFCKIYHNVNNEEVSGFGGESILKQKLFLNDFSTLIKDSVRREFFLDNNILNNIIRDNVNQIVVTYNHFKKVSDPPIEEMLAISKKISYLYGGLNLEEPDDIQDRLNMNAILSSVNNILIEDLTSYKDPNRQRVKEYLKHNMPHSENNIFYKSLLSNVMSHDFDKIQECIDSVQKVLDNNLNSSEDLKKARTSCQRLQEIVLDRDARLSGSISTKNRINPKFDVDKVSKIRNSYFKEDIQDQSGYLNSIITTSVMERSKKDGIGYSDSVMSIMDYYNQFKVCNSGLILYSRYQQESSFVGMKINRIQEDGSVKTLIKRITSEDSSYLTYGEGTRLDEAKFISYNKLTDSERKLFNKIVSDKYLNHNLKVVAIRLDSEIESLTDYIRSYLFDSLIEEVNNLI